jgi:thiol-disulfide isomerase/thioredoxin
MHPLVALLLITGLIAAATAVGLLWRARQGSLQVVADAGAPDSVVAHLGTPAVAGPEAAQQDATRPDAAQPGPTGQQTLTPSDLGGSAPFGSRATLVQFSTEFCSRCPATRRLLVDVASVRDGVVHLDVDLTHRADLANRFKILQTPTTLVLGPGGALTARINGVPQRHSLTSHLDTLTEHSREGNSHVDTPL